jgi:type I restriction enzyme S subunit
LDLARQFLTGLTPEAIDGHPHLKTLQDIIQSAEKTEQVRLGKLLELQLRPVRLHADETYKLVTVRLYGRGLQLRSETQGADLKGANWFQVRSGDLIMSKIDARNGAFGIIPEALDGAVVTNEFPVFKMKHSDMLPSMLLAVLTSPPFYQRFDAMVSGASGRRRVEPEEFLAMEIPIIAKATQQRIGARLDELDCMIKAINDEVEKIREEVVGLLQV